METLYTTLIGLVVGIIAKFLLPGKDPGGFIIATLLGMAGAFAAKFLGQSLNWYEEGEPAEFIASAVGAIILLVFYRIVFDRRKNRT